MIPEWKEAEPVVKEGEKYNNCPCFYNPPMQAWITILGGVLAVLLIAGVGAFARHRLWLTQEADQSLLRIIIRILMPCLVADTLIGNAALRDPLRVALPPLVGFMLVCGSFALIGGFLALGGGRLLGLDSPAKRRTFTLTTGLQNYGYLAVPLTQILFGRDTLAALLLHNVGVEIAMWTVGLMVLTGRSGKDWWKGFINPMSVAIAISLVANALDARAWLERAHMDFVFTTLRTLGTTAFPMALLVVGATILDFWPSLAPREGARVMAGACAIRAGVLPLMYIGAACLLPQAAQLWSGQVSPEFQRALVVQAAMPAALFPIVMARTFGGDPPTALRAALSTTLLALLTIPLWIALGMKWVGLAP